MKNFDGNTDDDIDQEHSYHSDLDRKRQNEKDRQRKEARYKSIALAVVMIGVMMTAVDTTAVVLGLPVMMDELHSSLIEMVWVIMAYLFVLTMVGTQVGKLGDMYGRVVMYIVGFVVFTAGSLLCGFASTGQELIVFRVIQAVGGALIFSNSGAIIADTFDKHERGKAYGYTATGYSVGAVTGILLGGLIINISSWNYIFFINVPVGVGAIIVSYKILKEKSVPVKKKLDVLGMLLLGSGLFLILFATTQLTAEGWTSAETAEMTIGSIMIVFFVMLERRSSSPLVEFSLFRKKVLTASIFAALLQPLASFAVLFLVVMYLQGVRNMSPLDASFLLIPGYLLGGVVGVFGGRLSDRYGSRIIASIGIACQIVGIFVYFHLSVNSHPSLVILGSLLNGVGAGLFYPSNNSAIMANAPKGSYGVASGILRTFANLGMVTSFALALLVASLSISRQQAFKIFLGVGHLTSLANSFITGMHYALVSSTAILVIALILSLLRGKEERQKPETVQI